jgi:hypothetical protein
MFNGNGKWNEEGKAIGMVIFLQRSSIINKGVQNCTYSTVDRFLLVDFRK